MLSIEKLKTGLEREICYTRTANYLAKKDEIIINRKPYSLIMSGWFTVAETARIKSYGPEAIFRAGLSVNWTWDNPDKHSQLWKEMMTEFFSKHSSRTAE